MTKFLMNQPVKKKPGSMVMHTVFSLAQGSDGLFPFNFDLFSTCMTHSLFTIQKK